MEALAQVAAAMDAPFGAAAAVFLRVSGLMLLLPAIGERMVPARVRLVAAAALTAVLAPLLPAAQVPPAITPALALGEVAVGAALGAALRFLAQALLVAGTIAAQAASLSQLFGAPSAEPSSAIGVLLHVAGLALLMASGLHLAVVEMLLRSWDVFPVGFALPGGALAEWGVARVGDAFALAVGLALPFVIVSTLYNLTLGVINKAMPQLMVALVGAPAITGLALATLAATAATILTVWRERVMGTLADPLLLP
ncbi:flagellar biosynthetic protein FliR [Jannaschia sp. W003]|uniref:flagellar biosynthetic protein FliR n=1 Tax=Jannaschia sp. W003 TaxID=2867012 RepID=UPI0021A5AF6C|nr:flagellar biosynthetic protein FliR [Jannaschia sp. W003]UWQ21828.1 flagellar biosynthetic protein FliR [Jannaschia sp. W003]